MHQNATFDMSVNNTEESDEDNSARDKRQTKNINFDRCGNDNKVSNIID